ncbi:hypothetical protein V5O48_002546 [Marasmius crinis-equi]|uniref:EthD domain-containing protein n=1 Tax=Marasmius crinis-equi TaxID=585013 RepID=A0ABR3FVF1_9AGAR
MADPKGLSFVFIEAGSQISEVDHYDWYDNEHSPARLTVPGFLTARRYKADDSQKPTYLTLYDLTEPAVANGPEYKEFHAKSSDRDKTMLSSVQFLNRRSYKLLDDPYLHPDNTDASHPGKFLLLLGFEIKPEAEDDFNRWYREEHIPQYLAKVPGWIRSRRYTLFDNKQRGSLENGQELQVCKYLALHDFTCGPSEFMEHEYMKASLETPWTKRVVPNILHRELRILQLHRVYKKPE